MVLLLVLLAHSQPPADVDCAVRRFALSYASALQPFRQPAELSDVHDGLKLGPLCGAERPSPPARGGFDHVAHYSAAAAARPRRPPVPGALRLHVHPSRGSDALGGRDHGDELHGSAARPFATVTAALRAARAARAAKAGRAARPARAGGEEPGAADTALSWADIVLHAGTHFVGAAGLRLGPGDSGTRLVAAPGEAATLSGALNITGLVWTAVPPPPPSSSSSSSSSTLYRAELPAGTPAFDQLYVRGRREILARHPNADPETQGLHTATDGRGGRSGFDGTGYVGGAESWVPHDPTDPGANATSITRSPVRADAARESNCDGLFANYTMGHGGAAQRYSPPRSYWAAGPWPDDIPGVTARWPLGLAFNASAGFPGCFGRNASLPPPPGAGAGTRGGWAAPETGVVHAFQGFGWGGWQFALNVSSAPAEGRLLWGRDAGGFQEARGAAGRAADGGGPFYVEGVLELLDDAREWGVRREPRSAAAGGGFVDALYYRNNATAGGADAGAPPADVLVPVAEAIVAVNGSQASPARNISVEGLTLAHSRRTLLRPHAAPSGGDAAVHRGAMVVAAGTEGFALRGCVLARAGGNGAALLGYARGAALVENAFVLGGESAVVLVGDVDAAREDAGLDGNQPRGTLLEANLAHGFGVWGKQTGFLYHFLAAATTVRRNVAFNGPRAGINLNDGFGGAHLVESNLLFGLVRETDDHGPINTWDRNPVASDVPGGPGTESYYPAWSRIRRNLLLNEYRSVWPIDHDDGSLYYADEANFLVYGGHKTFFGGNKTTRGSVYVLPDARRGEMGRLRVECVCSAFDSPGKGEVFVGNTCILQTAAGAYRGYGCNASSAVGDAGCWAATVANNTFYLAGDARAADWRAHCTDYEGFADDDTTLSNHSRTLAQWQALGRDLGSTVHGGAPSAAAIVAMGRALLLPL
jgi:hypothetical protein